MERSAVLPSYRYYFLALTLSGPHTHTDTHTLVPYHNWFGTCSQCSKQHQATWWFSARLQQVQWLIYRRLCSPITAVLPGWLNSSPNQVCLTMKSNPLKVAASVLPRHARASDSSFIRWLRSGVFRSGNVGFSIMWMHVHTVWLPDLQVENLRTMQCHMSDFSDSGWDKPKELNWSCSAHLRYWKLNTIAVSLDPMD